MNEKELGIHLQRLRVGRGITIRQLSERTGLSVKTICHVEQGRVRAIPRTLYRFAEGLGIEPDELMRELR